MKICNHKECERKSQAKGYCDKHYRRFLKYGDSSIVYTFVPKECSVKNCQNKSKSKGYCDKHYRRLIKTGTTEIIKKQRVCSIDLCERPHVAKNFCRLHYEMNRQKIKIDYAANEIISQHDGRCDICKSENPGFGRKSMCIDHDHQTGKVRGLLCQKCNIGIGNFDDNIALLERAIKYLKK